MNQISTERFAVRQVEGREAATLRLIGRIVAVPISVRPPWQEMADIIVAHRTLFEARGVTIRPIVDADFHLQNDDGTTDDSVGGYEGWNVEIGDDSWRVYTKDSPTAAVPLDEHERITGTDCAAEALSLALVRTILGGDEFAGSERTEQQA